MIRNDYILRLIEQFSDALKYMLRRRQERGPEAALEASDDVLRLHFGLGSRRIVTLSEAELYELLRLHDETGTEEKMAFVAALLAEEAAVYRAFDHEDDAYDRYLHALHLLIYILEVDPGFDMPEYTPALAGLREALAAYALPPLTLTRLIRLYERLGQLAEAEAVLVDWVEEDEEPWEPIEIGLQFYERLADWSDAALRAGGLSRADVVSGSAELRALRDELDA